MKQLCRQRSIPHQEEGSVIAILRERVPSATSRVANHIFKAAMQDDLQKTIPRVVMDTSVLPEAEQFAYWAAHTRGARLHQPEPGPFLCRGDMWNLGVLQATIVEVDPFVAMRDRPLVNAVDADYLQFVQLLEGAMTFEADDKTAQLVPPACFVRDASQPSIVTSTRVRLLMLYFSRTFLEEMTGVIDFQGPLGTVPELTLLREVATDMIRFFPAAAAKSAPLYAAILRDLTADAILCARASQRTAHLSVLAQVKAYVAAQQPGTLSIESMTTALGISRSALYRLFERDGGLLAYDRMRRLRAVHRAMCNPLNASTIGQLAGRYGFRDQAALLRSFRKAFGYSPSDLRQRHTITSPLTTGKAPDAIRQAFDGMD